MPMPKYLYHATPNRNAESIAKFGLQPRSAGGAQRTKYLCMSGKLEGAVTISPAASDIIFRVKSSELEKNQWRREGAGNEEWRSDSGIRAELLHYKRKGARRGQEEDWRPAKEYLKGT